MYAYNKRNGIWAFSDEQFLFARENAKNIAVEPNVNIFGHYFEYSERITRFQAFFSSDASKKALLERVTGKKCKDEKAATKDDKK